MRFSTPILSQIDTISNVATLPVPSLDSFGDGRPLAAILRRGSIALMKKTVMPRLFYHENGFWFRIDHLLYGKAFRAVDSRIVNKKYSDHYPLFVTLALKKRG